MINRALARSAAVLALTTAGLAYIAGTAAAGTGAAGTGTPVPLAAEEVETRDDVAGTAVPLTVNVLGSLCSVNVVSAPEECENTQDEITDLQF